MFVVGVEPGVVYLSSAEEDGFLMSKTAILLIDCNPGENTGETLEAMLTTARLGEQLRREVVVDPSQIQIGAASFKTRAHTRPSLAFLVLSPEQFAPSGSLIQSIKRQQPELPIIVVAER